MTYAYWIIGSLAAGILLLAIFGDHMIKPMEQDAHDPYNDGDIK